MCWNLISMDKRERLHTIRDLYHHVKEREGLETLTSLLAVPLDRASICLPDPKRRITGYRNPLKGHIAGLQGYKIERYIEASPVPSCDSPLTTLPDELLLEIVNHLDIKSCFCLSLSSEKLWHFCFSHAQRMAVDFMGTWAGSRIICLGNHDLCVLPPYILTEEEEIELRSFNAACGDEESEDASFFDLVRRDYRDLDFGAIQASGKLATEARPPRMLLPVLRNENIILSPSKWFEMVDFLAEGTIETYYPQTRCWILRNLTKQEYVRGDWLHSAFDRDSQSPPRGPFLGSPGFGEAVIMRTCWAARHGGFPTPYKETECGLWSGHRLEIRPEEYHDSHSEGQWEDVTSEVVQEISTALKLRIRMPEWETASGSTEGGEEEEEEEGRGVSKAQGGEGSTTPAGEHLKAQVGDWYRPRYLVYHAFLRYVGIEDVSSPSSKSEGQSCEETGNKTGDR